MQRCSEVVHELITSVQHESAAQPGIAADRFAREIIRFLKASPSALAAAECQPVGRSPPIPSLGRVGAVGLVRRSRGRGRASLRWGERLTTW
jgi:hypothetical protein